MDKSALATLKQAQNQTQKLSSSRHQAADQDYLMGVFAFQCAARTEFSDKVLLKAAADAFIRTIQKNKSDRRPHLSLAIIFILYQDYLSAGKHIRRALEIEARDPIAHRLLKHLQQLSPGGESLKQNDSPSKKTTTPRPQASKFSSKLIAQTRPTIHQLQGVNQATSSRSEELILAKKLNHEINQLDKVTQSFHNYSKYDALKNFKERVILPFSSRCNQLADQLDQLEAKGQSIDALEKIYANLVQKIEAQLDLIDSRLKSLALTNKPLPTTGIAQKVKLKPLAPGVKSRKPQPSNEEETATLLHSSETPPAKEPLLHAKQPPKDTEVPFEIRLLRSQIEKETRSIEALIHSLKTIEEPAQLTLLKKEEVDKYIQTGNTIADMMDEFEEKGIDIESIEDDYDELIELINTLPKTIEKRRMQLIANQLN